ncbi:MAG: hypothetical protein QOE89_3242 [Pseudonocardiales bacterium]|nr:hypothetical protein [Pseudonocardiales bacterium]
MRLIGSAHLAAGLRPLVSENELGEIREQLVLSAEASCP